MRRARATLALGANGLGPGAALVDRELRALNRDLSPLRDAHALVETLDRLLRGELAPQARTLLARARAPPPPRAPRRRAVRARTTRGWAAAAPCCRCCAPRCARCRGRNCSPDTGARRSRRACNAWPAPANAPAPAAATRTGTTGAGARGGCRSNSARSRAPGSVRTRRSSTSARSSGSARRRT
ncbi:hypothetical protein [Lysobacter enzymogenes]|uniref:hypothetical protein n=1 Tax=Lysobacter enzymogenes TaxID=69 RepID=UPI0037494D1A